MDSPRLPHLRSLCLLAASLSFAGPLASAASPPGFDAPEPVGAYFNGVFPVTPPGDPSGWAVENAFPNLTFNGPMMLTGIPGTNEFLVVGKTGLLWRIPKVSTATMAQRVQVLDWTAHTQLADDMGFFSLCFHPNFGQAGQTGENHVFVCYNRTNEAGVDDPLDRSYWTVSRFNWLPASGTIDPASEYIFISQYDPHQYHNGGATFFDNAGYLCIPVGDGGGSGDNFETSQRLNFGLFGGVMRIDVDYYPGKPGSHAIRRQPTEDPNWDFNGQPLGKPESWPISYTQGYGIPNDNPWQDPGGGILEEYYAIGLRSPHGAHYDPPTGEIWIGDIGQSNWEELDRVVKGSNCQWVYKEGPVSTSQVDPNLPNDIETPPIHSYNHTVGNSIIGGMRYRGTKHPSLTGKVIFGDHGTGKIWSLALPAPGEVQTVSLLYSTFHTAYKSGLSNFSTDSEGEIYMMELGGNITPNNGRIMKLAIPAITPDPPQFLSQTAVFPNLLVNGSLDTAPGVIPYDVPNPLWSDGAEKKRWVILPNNGSFDTPAEDVIFSAEGNWTFPAGTVFVKHFEAPIDANNPNALKRLETRFLICTSGGGKYGITYKWNAAGTDAELLENGAGEAYTYTNALGAPESRFWSYPSRGDCMACHNSVSGQALGVRTAHLNSKAYYPQTGRTANQLETFNSLGVFSTTLSAAQLEDYIEARALDDLSAPLEHRVRSYLDTNCSHCHQPGATGDGFDARLGTPLDLQNLINAIPTRYEELGPDGRYIKPGDSALSAVHYRASSLSNGDAMPPLAKNMVHGQGVAALQAYIDGLVPAEFDSPPAPHARYVKLTSITGKNRYVAVGEFTILDGEGVAIPHTGITATADLEVGPGSLAAEASDGNLGSSTNFWQTPSLTPSSSSPNHPHWLQLDLGTVRDIGGFIYYPRLTSSNGRIFQYQVHYSEDGTNWTLFNSGTWTDTAVPFEFKPGYNKRPARCQIAGPAGSVQGAVEATVVFDMDATDFSVGDLQVTGGSVSSLRGAGYYYVARILPAPGSTSITVTVPEDAVSPDGQGSLASQTLSITVIPDTTPPSPPGSAGGTPTTVSGQLSWTAATDDVAVEAYRILRDGVVIATVQDLVYTDTGLDPATEYDYQVIALDATGNASIPAVFSVTTLPDTAPPTAPGGFNGAPGIVSVQLSWTASTDNVAVDGYRIRRDGAVIATVQTLSFNDTGLASNTTYQYEVTALDEAGNSSAAALLTVTTLPDQSAPTVPGNLAGTPGITTVQLSWSASGDNVGVDGYRIRRDGVVIATVPGLGYTDTGLEADTSHDYEVLALDVAGNASVPAMLAVTTLPDEVPPGPPGDLAGTPGMFSVDLSWSAATDNVAVDGYRIRRNGMVVGTVQGLVFNDTGLQSGVEYNYEVLALDESGNASAPALLTVTTLTDGEPPSTPGNLAGYPDVYSITLSWSAATDNTAVTGYQIRRGPVVLATVSGLTYTETDLSGGTSYDYEVRAMDAEGNLSAPVTINVTTLGYEDWLADHGLAGQGSGDSDHGGVDNLAEFQLGMDPDDGQDDREFGIVCTLQETTARIDFPGLKPLGSYHLHTSSSLDDIANPANRVATVTRAQILAMIPAERSGHAVEIPLAGNRAFFVLVFEPAGP